MPQTGCVFKHWEFIQHLNITNSSSSCITTSMSHPNLTNWMTHPHATNSSSPCISPTQQIVSLYTSLNLLTQFPCHELNYTSTCHELIESLHIINSTNHLTLYIPQSTYTISMSRTKSVMHTSRTHRVLEYHQLKQVVWLLSFPPLHIVEPRLSTLQDQWDI